MAHNDGPWKHNPPPPRNSGLRFAIWIALLILGAIGLLALARSFPGSVSSDWDSAYLIRTIAILVLVSGSVVLSGRFKFRETVRHAAIWAAIFAVLAIGYTFQDELQDIGLRVRSALIPGYTVAVNVNEMVLSESEGGNFYVFGTVNGIPIRFLIDTGASDIVLSQADAKLIGISTEGLDYSRLYGTANGIGHGAMATVSSLTVGPISLSNVPVSINQAPMDSSLLGMTFLRRLKSFAIRNHRLYLRWR
jgi:aspartyl protease family protein